MYSVYGLTASSEIPLPELPERSGPADVVIRYAGLPYAWDDPSRSERAFRKLPEGVLLSWNSYARFLIRDGREVLVELAPGATDESIVRHLLLGPVFSVLHHQRGMAVFHASAVRLPAGGVAFMAPKGYGKSTQAAAFTRRGAPLITDDLLACQVTGERLLALPGVPFLKLWPPSMEMIGEEPSAHAKVKTNLAKRTLPVAENAVFEPVELRAIFLLDAGAQVEILPLKRGDALRRILPHWYGALFEGDLFPIFGMERQFWDCTSVVDRIPIYLLKRPAALDLIPAICQEIECLV